MQILSNYYILSPVLKFATNHILFCMTKRNSIGLSSISSEFGTYMVLPEEALHKGGGQWQSKRWGLDPCLASSSTGFSRISVLCHSAPTCRFSLIPTSAAVKSGIVRSDVSYLNCVYAERQRQFTLCLRCLPALVYPSTFLSPGQHLIAVSSD